jgi:hypothetical protein
MASLFERMNYLENHLLHRNILGCYSSAYKDCHLQGYDISHIGVEHTLLFFRGVQEEHAMFKELSIV